MRKIYNPDFNVTEFRNIKNQRRSNGFVFTVHSIKKSGERK